MFLSAEETTVTSFTEAMKKIAVDGGWRREKGG
jgi:hypothetical protein